MPRNTIFVSYSHNDKAWMEKLVNFLHGVDKKLALDVWVDTQIEAGDEWREKIHKGLASAKIAILVISNDFLISNFIEKVEIPAILRGNKERGLRIIPVIVRDCSWKKKKWIEERQALPGEGKILEEIPDHLQAREFRAIAEKIWNLYQEDISVAVSSQDESSSIPLPTAGQTDARDALERARTQKPGRDAAPPTKPIDHFDLIRCDLNQQVGSFKLHLTPMGCHAFSHTGDYSMIDQYIAKRLEWELREMYRRDVQSIRLHVKPRAFQGVAREVLMTLLSQAHPGCQLGEIFDQKDTDYFLLIEAQSVPSLELQEGAPEAWSGLCHSLGASLTANRSRMVALWINHDGKAPATFCAIPPLEQFDPDDVVVHFRGLLRDCGLAEDRREVLLHELWEYDGCLPATYHLMKEIVTNLGQGVLR